MNLFTDREFVLTVSQLNIADAMAVLPFAVLRSGWSRDRAAECCHVVVQLD